jgi:hypothetical protein
MKIKRRSCKIGYKGFMKYLADLKWIKHKTIYHTSLNRE